MQQHTINQRYRNYIQPNNQNVFAVIDSRLQSLKPGWEKLNILDFGCNNAHLLGTANGKIDPRNYWGVDISRASLYVARSKYPTANFIHFDGFNATFNPAGQKDAWFSLPVRPDVIIAYGVFTHTNMADIKQLLARLVPMLAPGGVLAFSVWEDRDVPGYLQFLKRRFSIQVQPPSVEFRSAYLINRARWLLDTEVLDIEDADWLEAFYRRECIEELGAVWRPGLPTLHQVFTLQT